MNKRLIILLILVGILLIGGFIIARANSGREKVITSLPAQTFKAQATETQLVKFLPPPPKQTFEAQVTKTQAVLAMTAAQITKYPDLGPTITQPASCPLPTPEIIGLIPSFIVQMPFGDHNYITGEAVAIVSKMRYDIWAGAPDDNPDQGLIRVIVSFTDPCASSSEGIVNTGRAMNDYSAPNGPLTILKIEGSTLIYSIASGGSARFNFVTGQFLPLPQGQQTIETSCPSSASGTNGISPFRGAGPSFEGSNLINIATATGSSGNIYKMWAGAPDDNPNQGLIRVKILLADPCADAVLGIHAPPMKDYLSPNGPLTFTRIEGDIIFYDIASGGEGSFNFVTGQFTQ